jgi:hypothetical protein
MAEAAVAEIEAILAEYPSVLWHHCPNGRMCHGTAGLVDFIVAGPRGILYREVKPHAGERPRSTQVRWKYALQASGQDWALWLPADVESGRVRQEIEAVASW